jgi:hypothetical protein
MQRALPAAWGSQSHDSNTSQKKRQPKLPLFAVIDILRQSLHRVLLAEALHAACGVHDLLLTGVERMAGGAHFDVQVFVHGRACFENVPATASNADLFVIGMNFSLHDVLPFGESGAKRCIILENGPLLNS